MDDLAVREARLYQQHQRLAQQLIELVPVTIRDHATRRTVRPFSRLYDSLAKVAAELVPLSAQLRQQASERMAEHRALVAQQAAERRRRERAAEQALQARRDQEWQRSPLRMG